MTQRVLQGSCRIAIAAAFLAVGIEANTAGLTGPTFQAAQTPPPGRGRLVQTPLATVPDLIGRTDAEARALLAKARLSVGQVIKVEAGSKPGTVVRQDRKSGSRVAVGTSVGFALAVPMRPDVQPLTIVPDLSGRSDREARAMLAKAQLSVGDVTKVEAHGEPGTVVKQDHRPGSRVAVGTPVRFALAVPMRPDVQPLTIVPDLFKRTDKEARELLAKARLTVGDVTKLEADLEPDTVIEQDRNPGSRVEVGTPVAFALAIPITVMVPNLSGRTDQEARELLIKGRLNIGDVTKVEASSKPGTVVTQDRQAGSRVEVGTPIGFALAVPIMVVVPDLSGRTDRDARERLANARLRVGVITKVEAASEPGMVVTQDRAPGAQVAVGTAVGFALAIPITVLVPSLSGLTDPEARELLVKARLRIGDVTQVEASSNPGTVVGQDRQAGSRVEVGTPIAFALAIPVTVLVPDLSGRTDQEARALLAKAPLGVGEVSKVETDREPGTVITQDRRPGSRVEVGTPVGFSLAIPITVEVPQLVDRTLGEAIGLLTRVRLSAGRVRAEESRQPRDSVLRQSVAARTRAAVGTAVDLVTAAPVTVPIPALVGEHEESARQRLADVELVAGTIEYQESATDRGTVLAQSVDPDIRVPLGTPVNLVVAAAQTVAVPSLVGMAVDQALTRLLESRLGAGDEQRRATNVAPPGTVLAQSNPPGTRVEVGTPIVLTVAAPLLVTVPQLVGLSHDAAAAAITAAGLEVGNVAQRFSLRAGGTVLAQGTSSGAQVQFGAPVSLDEARSRVVWLAPFVGVLFAAGSVMRARARTPSGKPPDASAPPLDVEVVAHVDAGTAHVRSQEARPIRREIRIQLVADGGSQELSAATGDLVRGERKAGTHDAPPPEEVP